MSQIPARASSTPLHRQMMESFQANIDSGEWPPGYRLPPETQLAVLFGVSRTTVRQAIAPLVAKGLLRRHRGQGTFVADSKYEPGVSGLWDLSEGIWGAAPPVHRTLGVRVVKASEGLARLLEVPARTMVIEVNRLRLIENEPVALERFHVLHEAAPGLAHDDVSGLLMYPLLVRRYGMDLRDATTWLEPTVLDEFEAAHLGARKDVPALLIRRILRNSKRQPLVSTTIVIRGDKCRYVMWENFRMTSSRL